VTGGYAGARFARRVNPVWVRAIIIAVSITVTAAFFLRS